MMAGSPNAFSDLASPRSRTSSVLSEQDSNARAPKRPRLSEDAVAAIHTQCADTETSLEVDHMTLDYLAYQATKACFASRNANPQDKSHISLSKNVTMFDTFLSLFKERHPIYTPDAELRFRIKLLKLTTLFTQRFTRNPTTPSYDSLQELRRSNKARAAQWIDITRRKPSTDLAIWPASNVPYISEDELERNRAEVLHRLGIPPEDEQYEDAYYGTMSSVSLLDIIPQFMQVTAARNAMSSSNLTQQWMHLAGELMLQACLERALAFGTMDVSDEAFSWGYLADMEKLEADFEVATCNEEINAMFEDDDFAVEVEGWSDVKTTYSKLLEYSGDSDGRDRNESITHLETVATSHPLATFETSLLRFLEDLSNSVPEPVLVQLEKGKLEGMTEQDTKDFLHDCGVGAAQFFETPVGFKAANG